MDQMCEADVLIGLYFDAAQPGADPTRRGADGRWAATAALLQGIQSLPKAVSLPVMSQEGMVLAFCKLFPAAWFQNFKFAMVEDLINSAPFST